MGRRSRTMRAGGSLAALLLALMLLAVAGCSGANSDEGAALGSPAAAESAVPSASAAASEAASATATPSPSETASPPSTPASEEPGAGKYSPQASSPAASAASPSASTEPSKRPASPAPEKPAASEIVLSVIGNDEWGTIIDAEQVQLKDGDTASSVLKRIAKAHRLAYEIRGSGALTYVAGIDGLFEFDDGPTSGWKYRVNGTVPDVGAGVYKLKPGDRLEWYYVVDDAAAASSSASGEEAAP